MDRAAALTVLRRLAAAGSLRPEERAELMRVIFALARPESPGEQFAMLEVQMAHLAPAERMGAICKRLGISRRTYFRRRKEARTSANS